MITAAEYRTAARVLREEVPQSMLAGKYEKLAEQREQSEKAFEQLGIALEDAIDPRQSSFVNGVNAYTALFQLDWTPPAGLF